MPPTLVVGDVQAATFEVCPSSPPQCRICRGSSTTDANRLMECAGCDRWQHTRCMPSKALPLRKGPWYCKHCKLRYHQSLLRDVMIDEALLCHLSHREAPRDAGEYARVLKASRYLTMDE